MNEPSDTHSKGNANIRCLVQAAKALNIPYEYYDPHQNLVALTLPSGKEFFAKATTPFNSHVVAKICKDKEFTYQILKGLITMPKTRGYLNPNCLPQYQKYLTFHSYEEVLNDMASNFTFPLIVKMNKGSQGTHVFSCNTQDEARTALTTIYNKDSYLFDYIALAQAKIESAHEYRVIAVDGTIELVYEKDISAAVFDKNLSPLHHENSKAVPIDDAALIAELQAFINPVFPRLPIAFSGLDIIRDTSGTLWLIEINASPGFDIFTRDNGDAPLVALFTRVLSERSARTR